MISYRSLLCIFTAMYDALHLDIISQTSLKITEVSYLLRSFNKISASVLFLGFRYFELQNIYKQISNHIRISIFSSEFVHR